MRNGLKTILIVAFVVFMNYYVTLFESKCRFGLQYGDRVVSDCNFADGKALLTNSKPNLLMALQIFLGEAARTGISINWKKPKVMVVQPKSDDDNSNLLVAGKQIEAV